MPNETLCGKAVIEMLLGEENGAVAEDIAESMVGTGDLPRAYVITRERMKRAQELDEVKVQDEKWAVGERWRDAPVESMRLV